MDVVISGELEQIVNTCLDSGKYVSASEVIREGLRLLKEKEERQTQLEALRSEIAIGLEQMERGETSPLDFKALRAKAHFEAFGQHSNA